MEKKILTILREHQGQFISGQKISELCHVSRMTISTMMKNLKMKGYDIQSSTKKGYCLTFENDLLFTDEIKAHINDFYHHIDYFETIDSTNDYLKQGQFQAGDIVIADHQSAGRGRNGRKFFSPQQKGIYLSFLLKPQMSIYDSLKITACCGVALVKTIQKNYPLQPQIKWVNDIILNDKKVAGILCEASLEVNTAKIESMVIGVGINVHHYQMPSELENIAGCLEDNTDLFVPRQKIIIDFLNIFYDEYQNITTLSFLKDYKQASYVLHQNITVYENNSSYLAYVTAINDDASLQICVDGVEKTLQSGEISIRKN